MRVVLDTDIGGDFDDVNALLLLLASPEVELVGVTTVGAGADPVRRAQVAATLLRSAGHRHVPVHAGATIPEKGSPILAALSPEHCLNAWAPEMADAVVEESDAADALPLFAQDAPDGEETWLVCIGAMTNVAEALRRDPAGMRRYRGIVAMSGAFVSQVREANVAIDPEATDSVYRSGIPVKAVGYEEASRAVLPLVAYSTLADTGSATSKLLGVLARRYAAAYATDRVVLYDASAVTALLRPSWFRFRTARVVVELEGTVARGMTVVDADPYFNSVPDGTAIEIAEHSEPGLITDLFRKRVLDAALP